MEVAFDPAKDEANRDKHGASLAFGSVLFDDPSHIVLSSIRPVDGESRYKVVGMAGDDMWTAVYVVRGSVTRFISVRRSNDGEERIYRT